MGTGRVQGSTPWPSTMSNNTAVLPLDSDDAESVRATVLAAIVQNVALDEGDAARRRDGTYTEPGVAWSNLTKDLAVAYQKLTDRNSPRRNVASLPGIVDEILR